jgi:hypothetical protein
VKTSMIGLAADGAEFRTDAKPIEDAAAVDEVVKRFRARCGADQVKAYYPKLDAAVEVPLRGGRLHRAQDGAEGRT